MAPPISDVAVLKPPTMSEVMESKTLTTWGAAVEA
jgi:hypothetical protein